jgi:adenine-specific DNA-methyltransferase
VLTPAPIAQALADWSIRSGTDTVLDLGVGPGAFLLAAADRLTSLGATPLDVAAALHGSELDLPTLELARAVVQQRTGLALPNVVHGDFYTAPLPPADVVLGNPPYVRRHLQATPDQQRQAANAIQADGMTDTYCYFLLRALRALRPGGRLAVIVSASWLDMRYGEQLKSALLARDFSIRLIMGFEGRVFGSALVTPVVLLGERVASSQSVRFARLSNDAPLEEVGHIIQRLASGRSSPRAPVVSVDRNTISPGAAWSPYLRTSSTRDQLLTIGAWTELHALADTRIGLQTFAKPFFILSSAEFERSGIESSFGLPLAFSPRTVSGAVLASGADAGHVLFACDQPLEALHATAAGRYIASAMRTIVPVRGTDRTVVGYHNAPRLARAGRKPWYNVRTDVARRGSFPILLPRRAFERFTVVHNRAGVIANEDFIEVRPRQADQVEPLLAFFNSTVGEYLVRSAAFQYGGGVFNVNPGPLRSLPVPDFTRLAGTQKEILRKAWSLAASRPTCLDRGLLDAALNEAVGLPHGIQEELAARLAELVASTRDVVRRHGEQDVVNLRLL